MKGNPRRVVIADAGPLIGLAHISQLGLSGTDQPAPDRHG